MALDLLLLENALDSPPVLRLYGFEPACLSIGLNQTLEEPVQSRAREKGFDIVRRPTGGRAVLHLNDLTYSFVAAEIGQSQEGVLERSVSAAYKQICAGLQNAFELLGLQTELGPAQASYRHLADCFLATTNADLHYKGQKLAGSAQCRRRGAVLQHGSIPLSLDQNLMAELLNSDSNERNGSENKEKRHENLFDALSRVVGIAELESAMREGFERAFQTELECRPLKENELAEAEKREREFEEFSLDRPQN